MKILVILAELNQEYGGMPVVAAQMLVQLANNGLKPVIIDGNRPGQKQFPIIEKYISQGLVEEISVPSTPAPFGYHFSPRLPSVIAKQDPDIVVIHGHHNWYSDVALIHGIRKRKNIVFFPHGGMSPVVYHDDAKSKIKLLQDWTFGRLYRKYVSIFVAGSSVETRELKDLGIETQRIVEIPHGVDTPPNPSKQDVEKIRDKFGLKTHHVMYFGRLHWRKGIQYLISAMSRILESNDDVSLTVSGPDDGMKASLEQMCRNLGISENVVFTGFIPRIELFGLMMNADVIVNPSNIECYGFTIAEAISLHKPVIQAIDSTESVHELPLVKDGVNGYIVKFRDVSGLANRIERIILNHDLREHLSENARTMSQSFRSWNQVGKEHLHLFEAMMA